MMHSQLNSFTNLPIVLIRAIRGVFCQRHDKFEGLNAYAIRVSAISSPAGCVEPTESAESNCHPLRSTNSSHAPATCEVSTATSTNVV